MEITTHPVLAPKHGRCQSQVLTFNAVDRKWFASSESGGKKAACLKGVQCVRGQGVKHRGRQIQLPGFAVVSAAAV